MHKHLLQKSFAFNFSGVKKVFNFNCGAEGVVIIPVSVVQERRTDYAINVQNWYQMYGYDKKGMVLIMRHIMKPLNYPVNGHEWAIKEWMDKEIIRKMFYLK